MVRGTGGFLQAGKGEVPFGRPALDQLIPDYQESPMKIDQHRSFAVSILGDAHGCFNGMTVDSLVDKVCDGEVLEL